MSAIQPITLLFPTAVNVSLQVGDTVYYLAANEEIVEIGPITSITTNSNGSVTIVANIDTLTTPPTNSSYIFFTKDSQGNTSNLKGYYAEAQFRNDKTTEVELFSVGSEIFESSK